MKLTVPEECRLSPYMLKSTLLLLALTVSSTFASVVNHNIKAEFKPEAHFLAVEDDLTIFDSVVSSYYEFELNPHLTVRNPEAIRLSERRWKLPLSASTGSIKIIYEGTVFDPIQQDSSTGLIAADGITLFGSSGWYPQREDDFVTFNVVANLPMGWSHLVPSSSQIQPQEEIYFVAGPFFKFAGSPRSPWPSYSVWLRHDERELAEAYLSKIPDFIDHYSQLIAGYPYQSFEVVENFWQTGFGMPSFTLLGSEVIRLPFLTTSSLPHEILHNWWGNSVYVDYSRGNWSEGLTTYMADHWQKKLSGADTEYRRAMLASFQDYVKESNDFPVRRFKGRHDAGTQAVGYGKGMFFFHMLRQRLGESHFNEGLRNFYHKNKFKRASFEEIEQAMTEVSAQNLHEFFVQWLDRTGWPTLSLLGASYSSSQKRVMVKIQQSMNEGGPYDLRVPVELTTSNGKRLWYYLNLAAKEQEFSLASDLPVTKVAVDPNYDLFRSLYDEEKPPTVSSILGSSVVHFLKASEASNYSAFIGSWKKQLNESTEQLLTEDGGLPASGALVFIGPSRRAQAQFNQALMNQGVSIGDQEVVIDGQTYSRKDHAFLLTAKLEDRAAAWVFWPENADAARLASRLTHYGSFSAVGFKGQPNVLKKVWRVVRSPLIKDIP